MSTSTRHLLYGERIPAAEQCRGGGQIGASFPGASTARRADVVCPCCSRTFNVRVGRAGTIRVGYVPRHRVSADTR